MTTAQQTPAIARIDQNRRDTNLVREFYRQFDLCAEVVTEWEESDFPQTNWMGSSQKAMAEDVIDACSHFCQWVIENAADRVKTPREAEVVTPALLWNQDQNAWIENLTVRPSTTDPAGGSEYWRQYQVIEERRMSGAQQFRLPETMDQLFAPPNPVPPAQIAKIYGWYDASGKPDVHKVSEERQQAGKHYNPLEWISKRQLDWEKQQLETFEAVREAVSNPRFHEDDPTNVASRPRPVAPETMDQLIHQGVGVNQIVKMMNSGKSPDAHVSADDVRARAAELRVVLDSEVLAFAPGPTEQRRQELQEGANILDQMQIDTHPEFDRLEDRALAMVDDGLTPSEVAYALKELFPTVTYQQVSLWSRQRANPAEPPTNESQGAVTPSPSQSGGET